MNKIFKVIYNNAKHCYVVACEFAKSYSKSGSVTRTAKRASKILAAAALGACLVLSPIITSAENSGGTTYGHSTQYIGNNGSSSNVVIFEENPNNTVTEVYGGKTDSGSANNNNVTMGGNFELQSVYGGKTNSGSANDNIVTISGNVKLQSVYGGKTDSGSANGNSVSIIVNVVNQSVYGGYANGNGDAKDNTVCISRGDFSNADIYGGYIENGTGDCVSGNELSINTDISVKNIHNFEVVYSSANITATGDITVDEIYTTGDVTAANISATGEVIAEKITATGDVNAANISATGDVTAVNITATDDLRAEGSIIATGDVTADFISATGDVTADSIVASGDISAANITATGDVDASSIYATGDVTAVNITATDYVNVANITATGNVTADTIAATGDVTADSIVASGIISAANITATGDVDASSIYATGDVNAENITATGDVNAVDITVTGDVEAGSITANTLTATNQTLTLTGTGSEIGTTNLGEGTLIVNSNAGGDVGNLTAKTVTINGDVSATKIDNLNTLSVSKGKLTLGQSSDLSGAAVTLADDGVVETSAGTLTVGGVSGKGTISGKDGVVLMTGINSTSLTLVAETKDITATGNGFTDINVKSLTATNGNIDATGKNITAETIIASFTVKAATINVTGDVTAKSLNANSLSAKNLILNGSGSEIETANIETIKLCELEWDNTIPVLAAESFKYNDSTELGGNVTLDISNMTISGENPTGSMTLLQSDTANNFSGLKVKYSDNKEAELISNEGQVVKSVTNQTKESKGITITYDENQSVFLVDSNKKVNYVFADTYKKAELGSIKWSDGGYAFEGSELFNAGVLDVSVGTDFKIDGADTQADDAQLVLLDYSKTTASIKDALEKTNIVEIQKDAASEMTFVINRSDSIKSDSEKKKVIYTVGRNNDVSKVVFKSNIDWNSETPYYNNTSFDFTNNSKIDASKLEFTFTDSQKAALSNSSAMTLISNASNQAENAAVTYKNNASTHSQQIDYTADNKVTLTGTMTGVINTSNSAVSFDVNKMTLDSINLAGWDGINTSKVPDGWSANDNGVIVSGVFAVPELVAGETINILTASNAIFEDDKIDDAIRYAEGSFNNALENGISHSGYQTGGVKASDDGKELTYYAMAKSVDKFNLANWDGEKSVNIPFNWELIDGISVETDNMTNLPESDIEKEVFILKSDNEGFFSDVAINGENIYGKKQNKFTESDKDESVIIAGTQDKGVTLDDSKTNLVYKFGKRDVSSLKVNTIRWEDGAELLNRDKYNYSKLTSIDTKDFNISYEKPETVAVNHSMTLLTANETFKDMAPNEKSLPYQYEPVSGVTMDAIIRSSLEAKNGKVTLTTLSNNAGKLTFGHVDWLDKGALIDHKTLLNNVSFDGASVDTTKIAFINKEKLDADMQMTLVSDFDGIPGTITGSKYKVGTAYEGEGSAYMDGNDLVFKTKTGAGLSDETHTTVMAMEGGVAMLAAGNEHVGNAIEGLSLAANAGSDGVSTYASMGGSSSRYETGSHVDSNSWNCTLAVGKNLEKRDGTYEYGLFAEYGRGNYTLHMDDVADAGSGNTHYTGGGLLLKFTNKHDVYTEASFRMGNMKDKTSSLLHDGAGNAYGYDISAKYRGGHIGFGKICREESGNKLELFGKYFYNQREGINFVAGNDQYSMNDVRSRVLRAGFRLSSTDRKWNRYGGIAYDYEFGGKSEGTVNGNAVRAASIKGGTLRGEFGYCREATKTNPWKTDISLYGFTGQRRGFGGSVAFEYRF